VRPKILVIEDEKKVAETIRIGFAAEGWDVFVAHTGTEGFYELHARHFDAVVLDIMLPGRDGLEILTTLRSRQIRTPLLLLTARDTIEDRVRGLEAGADDYLTKPFAFPELVARVKVLLRRGTPDPEQPLAIADLVLDPLTRRAQRGRQALHLTRREADILVYLLRHQRQVVTREMLARDVWGETDRVTPLDNVIDVHIAHLRKKIDDPFRQKLLHTVRGVGFRLGAEDR
jgi:DNA-binding response OmpR family regulator